ncbi:MAG: hypothetical protein AAB692_02555 [Patescibacteria group bacterium]
MDLFAWQTLIFLIPLTGGALLACGSLFGPGDGQADGDAHIDHDVSAEGSSDHDHDGHEGQGSFAKALSVLGIGRAPLMLVLSTAAMTWGVIGFLINLFLAPILPGWLFVMASVPIAFTGMVAITGRLAVRMSKIMPSTETYVLTRRDLIG